MAFKIGNRVTARVLISEPFNERFEEREVSEVIAFGETRKTIFGNQIKTTWKVLEIAYDDHSGAQVGDTFETWTDI